MTMHAFPLGERMLGEGHPPLFVAELGTCHEGSLEIAKENASRAVAAGADCIKTELFSHTEVFDPSARKTWASRTCSYDESLIEHMRRYEFTLDQHAEIKQLADELGVPFMATAHDFERVDFLTRIGAAAVKIASPDIVHLPLIRYAARSGLALFLDTGGAYQHEVEQAVKTARDEGCDRICVNHNPTGHPAPADRHDLRVIARFKELFDCPVGLADHYDGYEMVWAAVLVGAHAVEKPVSRDRFREACEHIWSVTLDDLPQVIRTMHDMYAALGRSERRGPGLRPSSPHRVALVAARDLQPGDRIGLDTVQFGKPRMGIGVEHWDTVVGRVLHRPVARGVFIQWEDL